MKDKILKKIDDLNELFTERSRLQNELPNERMKLS